MLYTYKCIYFIFTDVSDTYVPGNKWNNVCTAVPLDHLPYKDISVGFQKLKLKRIMNTSPIRILYIRKITDNDIEIYLIIITNA